MKSKPLKLIAGATMIGLCTSSFASSQMMSSLNSTPQKSTSLDKSKAESQGNINTNTAVQKSEQEADEPLTLFNVSKGTRELVSDDISEEHAREFLPPIEKSHKMFDYLMEQGKNPKIALLMVYILLKQELDSQQKEELVSIPE